MRQLLHLFLPSLLLLLAPGGPAVAQDVFTDCTSNSDNDATVVITTDASVDIGTGYSLEEGDEVAAITQDGTCAGVGVWNEQNMSFSIAGADADMGIDGFESGEELQFSVYHQESDKTIEAEVAYQECSENNSLCNDDGLYEANVIYELAANIIPVELSSFSVTQNGSSALLEWSTASETNNAGFEVQHQYGESNDWQIDDFVEGHGTTSRAQNYRHEISNLQPGNHRFRLHQIDFDGTSEYHPVRELYVEIDDSYLLTDIHPTPLTDQGSFELMVTESQNVRIDIFNQLGQQVDNLYDGFLSGGQSREFIISASRYSSGVYLVRVEAESFLEVLKLVIVR